MKLSAFDFDMINHYVERGYIRKQKHPKLPLWIYTYSTKTELEEKWDPYTMMCRGLVLTDKINYRAAPVIIRCVPKFFNSGQKQAERVLLSDPNTEITMKNDGYLIQIKKDSTYGLIITSKGSFTSPMVEKAKELVVEEQLEDDYTYICELCCNFPGDEAIIVKRWNEKPKLCVWAVIDPKGSELKLSEVKIPDCLERTKEFNYLEALDYMERNDVEGVVAKNGEKRVKFKTDHFMMMHRLISDIRKVRVWELLSKGLDLDSISIPDEFMETMKDWRKELLYAKKHILQEAYLIVDKYSNKTDKELALSEEDPFYKKLAFNIRKNKDIDKIVWNKIREQIKEENKNGLPSN